VAAFNDRRKVAVERMRSISGFELEVEPVGAFYVFPNVSRLFGRTVGGHTVTNADELCIAILERARVAIVPGSSFGSPDHVRISYATSMDKLREGLNRIERLLDSVEHNVTAAV